MPKGSEIDGVSNEWSLNKNCSFNRFETGKIHFAVLSFQVNNICVSKLAVRTDKI